MSILCRLVLLSSLMALFGLNSCGSSGPLYLPSSNNNQYISESGVTK